MSSATSTEAAGRSGAEPPAPGFQVWHFYFLAAMLSATVAVMRSPWTHPAALLLISAAVLSAGLAAFALHRALMGFWGAARPGRALSAEARQALEDDKRLVLRAIKELEFDRAMRKIGEADFAEMNARLRRRALSIMADLDAAPAGPPPIDRASPGALPACRVCGGPNDRDARFCKHCGGAMEARA
jgi:hypothetical protein